MKKSVSNRIRITKTGKVIRRAMGQDHFRAKKRGAQLNRRKKIRGIDDLSKKIVKKYL
ncbi:MAG: hypothetical protein UU85_C0004G0133 [Candidatus Wolfebacteria bacterium GW2011_GWA2_42_10]|uniref:50S ribosomal protein L35 n=2 Tax=Candidatus Wolfeibacteriota TaxID=1752735 RepID=A0A0G0XKE5_9BACT|nr:MAG: hypothetical protein UU38_C0001G0194 [Candidatus Wolfebacteria bacterium GW2011_GWB1_41_12]KKS25374.1 MAG: hypothetical protein UU85_C0004G0133 [Candidatus Wolfebacteria bacterium GW2011_GWA2_42_10]KKT56813.1 MAG: hypothetical protein UW50_C0001G0382 [Candidatus Wolfebacteria bacterium GW2011_GWA1_44_24]